MLFWLVNTYLYIWSEFHVHVIYGSEVFCDLFQCPTLQYLLCLPSNKKQVNRFHLKNILIRNVFFYIYSYDLQAHLADTNNLISLEKNCNNTNNTKKSSKISFNCTKYSQIHFCSKIKTFWKQSVTNVFLSGYLEQSKQTGLVNGSVYNEPKHFFGITGLKTFLTRFHPARSTLHHHDCSHNDSGWESIWF